MNLGKLQTLLIQMILWMKIQLTMLLHNNLNRMMSQVQIKEMANQAIEQDKEIILQMKCQTYLMIQIQLPNQANRGCG